MNGKFHLSAQIKQLLSLGPLSTEYYITGLYLYQARIKNTNRIETIFVEFNLENYPLVYNSF